MQTTTAQPFTCSKCGSGNATEGEIRAAGGFWTKFFNIQNKRFKTVTCTQCGYTELYAMQASKAGNVLDFFGN